MPLWQHYGEEKDKIKSKAETRVMRQRRRRRRIEGGEEGRAGRRGGAEGSAAKEQAAGHQEELHQLLPLPQLCGVLIQIGRGSRNPPGLAHDERAVPVLERKERGLAHRGGTWGKTVPQKSVLIDPAAI